MNYTEAFEQLKALAENFAFESAHGKWRLYVRPGIKDSVYVDLQHWTEGANDGFWYGVAHVSCEITAARETGVTLTTYINCTLCNRWSDAALKANGLKQLFELAEMFEEFTAGKTFDP